MTNLRILCEKYIHLDDELKELKKNINNSTNPIQQQKYVLKYISKLVEVEDFKSGMRRNIIKEFLDEMMPYEC